MNDRRICIFPGHLFLSGAIRAMLNLAEGIAKRGYEVDLFLTRPVGEFADQVPAGVTVHLGRGNKLASFPSLVRYLRRRRPAALITAHPGVNVMSILARGVARTATRVVVTVHNDTTSRPAGERRLRGAGLRALIRLTYPRAHAVVAVSEGVADDIARVSRIPRERIAVIYNPVITERLLASASDPVEHAWLAAKDPPVVLAAVRLTRQKDLPTLIRAFRLVRDAMEARLLMFGEGEDRPQLERLVTELRLDADVDMPGAVPNAVPYIARASVLALSSAWEGAPMVLAEALAVGTPVVSTDCRSGPREILDGGRYGELVPVGDYKALAEAIVRTLLTPPARDRLIERGRDFSVERATEQYLSLLGDPRPPPPSPA